jgi:hypothetical protein
VSSGKVLFVDFLLLLLFSPTNRKSESVKFAWNLPITGTSLLTFILNHAQPLVRWRIYFQLCDKPCLLRNLFLFNKNLTRAFRILKHFLSNYQFFYIKLESTQLSHRYLYQDYLQYLIEIIRYQKRLIKFNYHLKSIIYNKLLKSDQQIDGYNDLLKEIFREYSRSQLNFNQELDSSKEKASNEAKLEAIQKMNFKPKLKPEIKDEL